MGKQWQKEKQKINAFCLGSQAQQTKQKVGFL